MKEAIGAAEENKFSEFSKKVKTSLEDKLRNHPKIKSAEDKQAELGKVKDAFAAITKKDEPAEPTKTEEPVEPAEPAKVEDPAAEPAPAE